VIVWRTGGEAMTFQEGIDVWMSSFYHRLPLTDPGVMRLGWGAEEIYQVMDMGSLAAPYDKPYVVVYPYDGQTDVETAFLGDEHPDPVPNGPPGSVNEAELYGNPITIQTNPADERGETVDISMKLFEGKDGKKEVECFFSTPNKPTNPESAPAGCCSERRRIVTLRSASSTCAASSQSTKRSKSCSASAPRTPVSVFTKSSHSRSATNANEGRSRRSA
jgi:hypothetical protein